MAKRNKIPKAGERLVIQLALGGKPIGSVTYLFTSNTLNGTVEAVNIQVDGIRREFTRLMSSAGKLHILGGHKPQNPAEFFECVEEALSRLSDRWTSLTVLTDLPSASELLPEGVIP